MGERHRFLGARRRTRGLLGGQVKRGGVAEREHQAVGVLGTPPERDRLANEPLGRGDAAEVPEIEGADDRRVDRDVLPDPFTQTGVRDRVVAREHLLGMRERLREATLLVVAEGERVVREHLEGRPTERARGGEQLVRERERRRGLARLEARVATAPQDGEAPLAVADLVAELLRTQQVRLDGGIREAHRTIGRTSGVFGPITSAAPSRRLTAAHGDPERRASDECRSGGVRFRCRAGEGRVRPERRAPRTCSPALGTRSPVHAACVIPNSQGAWCLVDVSYSAATGRSSCR